MQNLPIETSDSQKKDYLNSRIKEWALMAFPWQLKRTSALSLLMRTSAILAIKVELPMSILIKRDISEITVFGQ